MPVIRPSAQYNKSVVAALARPGVRAQRGISLIECMVAVIVGSILLYAVYSSASTMYKASVSGENQVLATNMAQQVIDNARNCTYDHLHSLLGGANTLSQTLNLYDYPSSPSTSFFPRPLLRNLSTGSGLTYTTASTQAAFPGTVTETLNEISPYDPYDPTLYPNGKMTGQIRVTVNVTWSDNRGTHTYSTGTTISQSGIHN